MQVSLILHCSLLLYLLQYTDFRSLLATVGRRARHCGGERLLEQSSVMLVVCI